MKNLQCKSSFYFSAYPLKALNLPQEEQKKYFHLYKQQDKTIRRTLPATVMPMMLSSELINAENSNSPNHPSPDHIEVQDTDWYVSYE